MKKTHISFLAGAGSALILSTCAVSALASSGIIQITASPISVMVNGQVFKPKDANGNDALVFNYNGTTYAPLRALAESYGLTVGYDKDKNMATVTDDENNSSNQGNKSVEYFKSVWNVKPQPKDGSSNDRTVIVTYSGSMNMSEFRAWWKSLDRKVIKEGAEQLALEVLSTMPNEQLMLYFDYNSYALGTVFTYDEFAAAHFEIADSWV